MWFEIIIGTSVVSLFGLLVVSCEVASHNRNILKSLKQLLPNESAFAQPKIQEYVHKLLEQVV